MKRGFVPAALAFLAMTAFAASAQAVPHSKANGLKDRNSCGVAAEGSARCHAKVVTDDTGATFDAAPAAAAGTPAGWGPADLRSAYKLPSFSDSTASALAGLRYSLRNSISGSGH